ncbi:hypothetical protein CTI12_AA439150 [Artemisia annua]|uniref:Uncharacterized protein n=1 Tax=Artemisia annua TaxID=35608 RepID=A0A2U1LXP1_ARTAN|nr:hypothetical protein CTI12_AA439150 [Artemisia annua]
MTMDPPTRTRPRNRRRTTCPRHPNSPTTGLCALCLTDRLTTLDSSSSSLSSSSKTKIISFPMSRRTVYHAGASSSSSAQPELRRSKSVAVEKLDSVVITDQRRKSCDVRVCNTNKLNDLFGIDDVDTGGYGSSGVRIESKNLEFSSIVEPVLEIFEDNEDDQISQISQIRVLNDDIEFDDESDLMTMKEHIEIELRDKKKNIWDKLRKWGRNGKKKDINDNNKSRFKDESNKMDYGLGRRSCDTAPRFSLDVNRLEDGRLSYDEHRASWDGYMIARTIPRLTPMLPVVDDVMLGGVDNRLVTRIKEESSSSGGSAKSSSGSCSLNTGSSSSSMKSSSSKTVGLEEGSKLVITEKELKDWHLRSVNVDNVKSAVNASIAARAAVKNSDGDKKETNSRWRKMSSLWSYKHKPSDKKNGDNVQDNGLYVNRSDEMNGVERRNSSARLVRNGSMVGSRNKGELHRNGVEGGRHSMSDIDSGLLKLYLSPFSKSKTKLPQSVAVDG